MYPKEEGTNDARHINIVTGSAFADSFRGNPSGLYCSYAVCSSPPANECGTATSTFHFVVPTEFKNGKAYALIIDVFDDRTYPAS